MVGCWLEDLKRTVGVFYATRRSDGTFKMAPIGKEQLPEGYFKQINQFLDQVYASGTSAHLVKGFQALKTTNLEEVKVV